MQKEIYKVAGIEAKISEPDRPENGDFSTNVAFLPAKSSGRKPQEIAKEIKEKLSASKSLQNYVEKIEVAGGGFINFYLSRQVFIDNLADILKLKDKFGRNENMQGKKVIVEYTDPNLFKEFHIGHLMSNIIGESLTRIVEFSGAEVKRANYQGDVGIHVVYAFANLLREIKEAGSFDNWTQGLSDEEIARKIFKTLDYSYGFKRAQENEEFREAAKTINKKIYDRSDPTVTKIYDIAKKASLAYFKTVYGIIGMKKLDNGEYFDYYFLESDTGEKGKEIVDEGLKKGIFEKSDGATVFRGEKYGLHTRVFINRDGLPTYEAKELGLAVIKHAQYPFDTSLVVTGNEIVEYFKVVLEAEKQLYPDIAVKTKHIPHGMLRVPSGKMSSRTGDVITAEALYDEVKKRILEKINESKNVSIEDQKRDDIADKITLGAIKYSILHQSIGSDIIFDFDTSLSFEGASGPYIQYSHARAMSVLEKGRRNNLTPSLKNPHPVFSLERILFKFPDVVFRTQSEYDPHYLCTYLFYLAKEFNNFYEHERIIDSDYAPYRLALAEAVATTIKNGLWLLGISAPEKM